MTITREVYSANDTKYIKENHETMTNEEIGNVLGRSEVSIKQKLVRLKRAKLTGYRDGELNSLAVISHEIRLLNQGEENKKRLARIRADVRPNMNLNIQFGMKGLLDGGVKEVKIENCKVIFKTFNYFTIQHEHYRESFNFTDVLMGNIVIMGGGL